MEIKSHNNVNGFTLIEVMVTIAIMAIITGVVANGYNRSNSATNAKLQTEIMTSDLRSMALSALNSETFQTETTNGWGLYLDATNKLYTVFADLDNDKTYDNNEKFKSVNLNPTLFLCLNWESQCHTTGTVFFDNTTVVPYMNSTQITTTDLEVIITDNVSGVVKTISLNSFGAVSHN